MKLILRRLFEPIYYPVVWRLKKLFEDRSHVYIIVNSQYYSSGYVEPRAAFSSLIDAKHEASTRWIFGDGSTTRIQRWKGRKGFRDLVWDESLRDFVEET